MLYQQFWPYAIFVIVSLVCVNYLAETCMSRDFGAVMVFLGYVVLSYLVATGMRYSVVHIHDARERSVRLMFDSLIGLYLLVTGYCRYSGRLLGLPGRVLESGVRSAAKAARSVV